MYNIENILDNEVQTAQPKLRTPRVGLGLDFSIENDLERAAAVDKLFQSKGPNRVPTQKEQEIITTYLLYGRTESGKSPIHDKDILSVSIPITPKHPIPSSASWNHPLSTKVPQAAQTRKYSTKFLSQTLTETNTGKNRCRKNQTSLPVYGTQQMRLTNYCANTKKANA